MFAVLVSAADSGLNSFCMTVETDVSDAHDSAEVAEERLTVSQKAPLLADRQVRFRRKYLKNAL